MAQVQNPRMCNRYGYQAPVSKLADAFSEIRIPLRFEGGAIPNLEPRDHIRPTDTVRIVRPVDASAPGDGVALTQARWWLIPFFHRKSIGDWKAMCTNARAETAATTATFREPFRHRRCLVPATHFFEWTGPAGRKTMWRFTSADAEIFCFAGLWDRATTTDGVVESFAILTCAAGPDCAPYHDRQPIVLAPARWRQWLDLGDDPSAILKPGPAGSITVRRAVDV